MKEWRHILTRARLGDLQAFDEVVRQFRDMAVGYAYSILLDSHLAEDAAQEAFIESYLNLAKLRDADAFPAWLRKIVFKQCDRLTRGKRLATVALDEAEIVASRLDEPPVAVERREVQEIVRAKIRALPQEERVVTALFYINGYSQLEIGEFLDMPLSTVKNRLHSARQRLHESTINAVREALAAYAPKEEFNMRFAEAVAARQTLEGLLGKFPVLESAHLRLREVRPREDAERWASLLRGDGTSEQAVTDLEVMFEGVRSRFYDFAYVIYWAIARKDDDHMIGNIRFWEWQGHPECGLQFGTIQYDLASPYANTATAAEALRMVGDFGLRQLGLARVQCVVRPDNAPKIEALTAAGFTREGTLRCWWYDEPSQRWIDEVMFSLVEGDIAR